VRQVINQPRESSLIISYLTFHLSRTNRKTPELDDEAAMQHSTEGISRRCSTGSSCGRLPPGQMSRNRLELANEGEKWQPTISNHSLEKMV
jgi:hypothetical protein